MNYNYESSDNPHYFADGRFFVPQGATAATTSIQTANQLGEVNNRLNAGVFGIDIAPINPEILEQIPREHFKEMNRLSKLSGATVSMHGPILDLVGFDQNRFDELKREQNERFAVFAMDRAHDLNPQGNTFMNLHINNQTIGDQWRKARPEEIKAAQKKGYERLKGAISYDRFGETPAIKELMGVVNRDTGEYGQLKLEVKEYPDGPHILTPDQRLNELNRTSWRQAILPVFDAQKTKRELQYELERQEEALRVLKKREQAGLMNDQYEAAMNKVAQRREFLTGHINEIDVDIHSRLNDVFHKLQYTPENAEEAQRIKEFSENLRKEYLKKSEEIKKYGEKLRAAEKANDEKALEKIYSDYLQAQESQSEFLQAQLTKVGEHPGSPSFVPAPELFAPANRIAKENTIKTVANVVAESVKRYGENAPVLTLENYQPYLTLGTSKDMQDVINDAREEIVKKLVNDPKKPMTPDQARAIAEKNLGATWDVGHINFMKRHGFNDKDILEETKKAAPYVKQLHITDNFGFSDAHMPPGMGDSPIEKQFKILQDEGFNFDEKGRVIVEAGAYVGQFKDNPHVYTLEQFRSPIYSTGLSATWDRAAPFSYGGNYGTGFGNLLPEKHFTELYGAGFSTLPRELGGNVGNDRDRFSGTPLQ